MSAIRTYLDAQDGPIVAAAVIAAFVVLVLLCALYNALVQVDRQRSPRPRRESMSERHDRIDREAAAACAARSNVVAFKRLPKEMLR